MRITLCGSTRFRKQYEEVNRLLSKQGHVVLSLIHISEPTRH